MDKERMAELEKIEAHGAENGWVTPMTEEDKAYFAYFRSVFKRYNILCTGRPRASTAGRCSLLPQNWRTRNRSAAKPSVIFSTLC